jgi:hypothetical protein
MPTADATTQRRRPRRWVFGPESTAIWAEKFRRVAELFGFRGPPSLAPTERRMRGSWTDHVRHRTPSSSALLEKARKNCPLSSSLPSSLPRLARSSVAVSCGGRLPDPSHPPNASYALAPASRRVSRPGQALSHPIHLENVTGSTPTRRRDSQWRHPPARADSGGPAPRTLGKKRASPPFRLYEVAPEYVWRPVWRALCNNHDRRRTVIYSFQW